MKILGISNVDEDTIKKAYRVLALRYHPDKNSAEDAAAKFQEVHDAYVYLIGCKDDISESYTSLLGEFLRTWINGTGSVEQTADVLHEWIRRITCICEEKALALLQNIDKHIMKTMYGLLSKNREVLHLSDGFIEKMCEVLKSKFENDERIILHPFLDDLENIYRVSVGEEVFLIPLWHHHLVYDTCDGREIYVDCYPLLPENIWLDEYNHIHISIKQELMNIWTNPYLIVEIGSRKIEIDKNNIRMVETQVIECIGKGIMPPTSISGSDKSNVYVHLEIHS